MDFLLGFAAALAVTWMIRRVLTRRKYLAACEYWIYLPEERMPAQDALMQAMLGAFWGERGSTLPALPVTPAEGRLLSDVRLHVGLVLRSKNPHVFRPDLFGDGVVPTPELLAALSNAKALAKIRYVSEVKLSDRSLLTLVPAMAGTMAHLAGSEAVFDAVSEHLQPASELSEALKDRKQLDTPEWNARILWCPHTEGGHAETRGLVKVGLPEIATHETPADARVLVCSVLEAVVAKVWEMEQLPPELEVDAFSDTFKVTLTAEGRGPFKARVHRVHTPG